jgi:undecaprenyl diphosphate synthase
MYLHSKTAEMHKNGVRLKVIGDRARLSAEILSLIEHAENLTCDNTTITVNMAVSYSGKWDIARATKMLAEKVAAGELNAEDIGEELIAANLSTAGMPDPDLIVRTSGEQRISNFLLWQLAYTELVFLPVHWPAFDKSHLEAAIAEFRQRERRYGASSG